MRAGYPGSRGSSPRTVRCSAAGIGSIRPDNAIQGAAGKIGFGAATRLPVDKTVLVLRADTDETSTPRLLCGELPFRGEPTASLAPDGECPRDL